MRTRKFLVVLAIVTLMLSVWAYSQFPYESGGTAGHAIQSGRVITALESTLTHPTHGDGLVDKGDPCYDEWVVGIAVVSAAAATDYVSIDTTGIWNISVVGNDETGSIAVAIGDQLYVGSDGVVDKDTSGKPLGTALNVVTGGSTTVTPVLLRTDAFDPTIVAWTRGTTAAGQPVSLVGGPGGSSSGAGGAANVTGGTATGNAVGGAVVLTGGDGGSTTGTLGGAIDLNAGNSRAGNTAGAVVTIDAGDGFGSSAGGAISLTAGPGGATGAGGVLTITAGAGGASSGNGSDVVIVGGAGTAGDGDGGDLVLTGGAKNGSGTAGAVTVASGDDFELITAQHVKGSKNFITIHSLSAAERATPVFVAPIALTITNVYEVHGTVCDTTDVLNLEKNDAGENAGAGDLILTTGFTLNSTADTPVNEVPSDGGMTAGQFLYLRMTSGDATNWDEAVITIEYELL